MTEPWDAISDSSAIGYRMRILLVLEHAGCSLPKRDSIDTRIIDEVRTGTAAMAGTGSSRLRVMSVVGRNSKSGSAPADTDNDGMPDDWEAKHGLDANNASDHSLDKDGDGYTNVEEYLNGTDPTMFVDYTESENNVSTLGTGQ